MTNYTKSFQYLAFDPFFSWQISKDSKPSDIEGLSKEEIAADEDVKGFLFSKLIERLPQKKQELLTFRDHLLSTSNVEETLKVLAIIHLNAYILYISITESIEF